MVGIGIWSKAEIRQADKTADISATLSENAKEQASECRGKENESTSVSKKDLR
jgi:hypothetical protein